MKTCDPQVNTRLKREVNTDFYDLEKGPIIILRDPEEDLEDEEENEEESGENRGISETSEEVRIAKTK